MTTTTAPTLNKTDREMLDFALSKVEALKTQRRELAEQINERMTTLANRFGEQSVEFENEEGRTVKFRLVQSKRTSYKAVIEEVKAESGKPLRDFIDKSIKQNSKTSTRTVLTAGKAKRGRPASADAALVTRVRMSYGHTKNIAKTASTYSLTQKVVSDIVKRKGAYAAV